MKAPKPRFSTLAVHAGQEPDPATGSVMTPVYLTSTYRQSAPGRHSGYEYSRTRHPTRQALEDNLAALEGGRFGLCFASGMAAISVVAQNLGPGDHVVCSKDVYGGTYRVFTGVFQRFGVRFTFADCNDLRSLSRAFTRRTRLLWLESPTNPLLKVVDLAAAAKLARERGVRTAVDNTFATPALQRPLELGCDVVVHSTTKYLGGHSDVVGGCVVTSDEGLFKRYRFLQNALGAVPGPMDCFLVLRGTKTLPLRMERHCANASAMARFLAGHPEVLKVHYPGLPGHPGYETARRQMKGFGGMVSFELKGGASRALRFLSKARLFTLAESLGGVESLVGHPSTMSHAGVPRAERLKAGITDGLVRLSVGIEDPADLRADLERAIRLSGRS
ncbi:MAG: cystathionine gamma-synthase [Elusimicrobiota bacterium]|jgi:cystathionine gamma-lyase